MVGLGEEGRAAPDGNPVAAPEVCEVVVCAAGCTVATAAGESVGAGRLLGATTLLSGFLDDTCSLVALVTPACFATAAFDAAGGMAGQIVACLCPGQAHLIGSHSQSIIAGKGCAF